MKIPVTLNGKKIIFEAKAEDSLLEVLRQQKLFSVKKGCGQGHCGYCTVLLDDKPVPSCLIPVGIVKGSSIVTLEYFAKTPAYADIADGFEQAGVHPCGWCNAAKYFSVYSLLTRIYRPSKEELNELADEQHCSCTNHDTFINGVLFATANRHKREGRKNGL
ncbi:MAG: 2Fe-2S iron-sulfur cluster binding domain-containing protein [Treponema sp.]|nr:2Fe-2S iron-sulfur cluster binding domain-containing protein [Treponema sp.]